MKFLKDLIYIKYNCVEEKEYKYNIKFALWALFFVLLYVWLYYFFYLLAEYFPQLIKYFSGVFGSLSFSLRFFVLFSIQEMILLGMLFLTFFMISWTLKSLWKNVYQFFKTKFVRKGFKPIFTTVLYSIFIYFLINSFLMILLKGFWITIPWLNWKEDVAVFLSWWHWNSYLDYAILIFSVSILWPLVEEIIYRWFITSVFLDRYWKYLWIILSSFLFTLVHFEWWVFLNLLMLSFMLSYVYYRTQSLYYSFAFHFIINFLWVLGIILS